MQESSCSSIAITISNVEVAFSYKRQRQFVPFLCWSRVQLETVKTITICNVEDFGTAIAVSNVEDFFLDTSIGKEHRAGLLKVEIGVFVM